MTAAVVTASAALAQTAQADFDAAQAKMRAGDHAGAAASFDSILAKYPKLNPRTAAAVRTLLGQSLVGQGLYDDAIPHYEAALAGYAGASADDRRERALLRYDLGLAEENRQAFAVARDHYAKALAENGLPAEDRTTLALRVALARTSAFADPERARRELDAALPLIEAALADNKRGDQLGDIYSLRGRIELNQRNYPEARRWFDKALKTAGGMGTRVTIADTRIRSDLAIVHHLLGNQDDVRRYLAYTGAGRMPDDALPTGNDLVLPTCGAATGVKPDDMVIVEFAVSNDGRVLSPMPIYSTRPGQIEEAFLKEVAHWTWAPEVAAKLPAFWRASVRVELRCTNQPSRASLRESLLADTDRWLAAQGIAPAPAGDAPDAVALPQLRAELARREAAHGGASVQLLPVLRSLAGNAAVNWRETAILSARAADVAVAAKAPAEVWVPFAHRVMEMSAQKASSRQRYREARRSNFETLLKQLTDAGLGESRAAAFVRAELGTAYEELKRDADAMATFTAVVDQPKAMVSDADPIRQLALLRLASLKAASQDVATARQLLQATGLSADQCALVDVQPLATNAKISSDAFPSEAMRWGFDGMVRVAYDIDTAGRAIGVRTVMAYPPFIFGGATEKAVSRFRFRPIFRDGATIGCTGREQQVRYLMPH